MRYGLVGYLPDPARPAIRQTPRIRQIQKASPGSLRPRTTLYPRDGPARLARAPSLYHRDATTDRKLSRRHRSQSLSRAFPHARLPPRPTARKRAGSAGYPAPIARLAPRPPRRAPLLYPPRRTRLQPSRRTTERRSHRRAGPRQRAYRAHARPHPLSRRRLRPRPHLLRRRLRRRFHLHGRIRDLG